MGTRPYEPPGFEASTSSAAPGPYNISGDIAEGRPARPKGSLLSFEYYSWYFDVETNDVLSRCLTALFPIGDRPFFTQDFGDEETGVVGGGNPDLYGPFWISTTVVFMLFFSSTLLGLMFTAWQGARFEYQFGLLTGAAGLMYGYTIFIPLGLWLVIKYVDIAPHTTLLQLICLYGYSNIIWIPVAILSAAPLLGTPTLANVLRWIFVAVGFGLSAMFLTKNVYRMLVPPDVGGSVVVNKRPAFAVLAAILLLHVGLSFIVKMTFFG
jgi:hypothetical protein